MFSKPEIRNRNHESLPVTIEEEVTMYCPSCGSETPEQGVFCLHCGTRLNKECPQCAKIVKAKAKVCRFCGYKFTAEQIAEIERNEQERIQQIGRASCRERV